MKGLRIRQQRVLEPQCQIPEYQPIGVLPSLAAGEGHDLFSDGSLEGHTEPPANAAYPCDQLSTPAAGI
jgi:hypothetical protein